MAYALLQRGYEIWADDAVAFTAVAGTATAVPLPFTLRLRDETVAFFQRAGIVKSPDNGKVESPQRAEAKPLAIASVSLLETLRDDLASPRHPSRCRRSGITPSTSRSETRRLEGGWQRSSWS